MLCSRLLIEGKKKSLVEKKQDNSSITGLILNQQGRYTASGDASFWQTAITAFNYQMDYNTHYKKGSPI